MTAPDLEAKIAANRANWNARAKLHVLSPFYNVQRYIDEPKAISSTVQWDRTVLGEVAGLDMLHLQCHIGTDTISWARLGANMVGLDFSEAALEEARKLAAKAGFAVEFVQGDAREADRILGRQFDVVYASVGVLPWIPDVGAWARAAAACLRPGGRLYLRDGHPILATLDYARGDDQVVCISPYFRTGVAERDEFVYSYTGDKLPYDARVNFQWQHTLGEILGALLASGLQIQHFQEHDWLDWQALDCMVQVADGRWRLPGDRIPLAYTVIAVRPG